MSKKNRAKSKAKRFGEGSAKPIVSAATYGVGGNAFAQAIADPVSTVHSNNARAAGGRRLQRDSLHAALRKARL